MVQPFDPDAQVALGNALFQKGLVDDAIVHYETALALRPYYVIAHYSLSTALLQKGELDAAISHCRAALSIQPEHAEARINLAIALDQKGQVSDAIMNYEKALTISPRSVPALNNLAWILAACSNASSRNGNKALELARQADQFSSRANLIVRRTLAAAYAETGQFAKAIEIARDALRLAEAQGDSALAAQLQKEIAIYQAGSPYREGPN
jgi:tetratricopeptide (TPR) repeat protein